LPLLFIGQRLKDNFLGWFQGRYYSTLVSPINPILINYLYYCFAQGIRE